MTTTTEGNPAMTTTDTLTARLAEIAEKVRADFDNLDAEDMEALRSGDGLMVDDALVWVRTDDLPDGNGNRVVVWAGNDLDFDMQRLVEVDL